ncbi:MAG: hypothetical protein ACKVP7_09330 [Hyphomicrobiaceae bacterium]
MRQQSRTTTTGQLRAAAIAFAIAMPMVPMAMADAPSGHDIAERFAADSEKAAKKAAEHAEQQRQKRIEAELKRNEADMLARARAEAAARDAGERAQRDATAAAEAAARQAEMLRQEEAKLIEEARRADFERAETARRAEAEARAVEERRRVEAARAAEEERAKAASESARREALARERAADAQRVSDALREAREANERRLQARETEQRQQAHAREVPPPAVSAPTEPRDHLAQDRGIPTSEAEGGRFAVLLVMAPGNRGIRRHKKTADPVLCMDDGCYVSTGSASAATLLRQRQALGIGRTLGARAGACENTLGCVFREVEIPAFPSYVQPVDMRVVRHDRRAAQTVAGGSDCYLAAGRLGCRQPVQAGDYVIWLVPERMAKAIGPELLEQAVADGLSDIDAGQRPVAAWR